MEGTPIESAFDFEFEPISSFDDDAISQDISFSQLGDSDDLGLSMMESNHRKCENSQDLSCESGMILRNHDSIDLGSFLAFECRQSINANDITFSEQNQEDNIVGGDQLSDISSIAKVSLIVEQSPPSSAKLNPSLINKVVSKRVKRATKLVDKFKRLEQKKKRMDKLYKQKADQINKLLLLEKHELASLYPFLKMGFDEPPSISNFPRFLDNREPGFSFITDSQKSFGGSNSEIQAINTSVSTTCSSKDLSILDLKATVFKQKMMSIMGHTLLTGVSGNLGNIKQRIQQINKSTGKPIKFVMKEIQTPAENLNNKALNKTFHGRIPSRQNEAVEDVRVNPGRILSRGGVG